LARILPRTITHCYEHNDEGNSNISIHHCFIADPLHDVLQYRKNIEYKTINAVITKTRKIC